MANPFLFEDATSTFADSNNTFNPFLTNTSAETESHNDNPFFSTFGTSDSAQDNTNPFLAFTQKSEPAQPVADLLGINEKSQNTFIEDALRSKPAPPRPAPPKRPPPRPTPPSHDAKELILSVTGEMDATSLHLLDRLGKTPSPTPMRDLLTPSPTPTADLLGCEDLQPPTTCQPTSVFDQQSNIIDLPSGPKPERPKFPPKIDFLMDDLLEDVPIDEGIPPVEDLIQKRTPSIPENPPIIGGSKPSSRKSSNEFIPTVRRLSHDVTESRKIMPDISKIADRRKSDIGHFAPIVPSRKPTSQSDQSLLENKPENIIQEINESEEKPNAEKINNVPDNIVMPSETIQEQKLQEVVFPSPPNESSSTWEEEKNGLDFDSKQFVESTDHLEMNTVKNDVEPSSCADEPSPFESVVNENVSFNDFDVDTVLPSSEAEPFSLSTEKIVKSVNVYDAKPIPPIPDSSPFQEIPSHDTQFGTVFETPKQTSVTSFNVKETTEPELFSESTTIENDAFDAFAAKFDDSQNDVNACGGAFDAFGGISEDTFDNSAIGFGVDDNFDSFLSTHPIPTAPQSTPAKVTRNNSGESLDENDFNVFIRYLLFIYIYTYTFSVHDYIIILFIIFLGQRPTQTILISRPYLL